MMRRFQHNKSVPITFAHFAYVQEYKRQLLANLDTLMSDIGMLYTISHGNLIEYERKSFIYHDDDIDIRWNRADVDKWEKFCESYQKENIYNLSLDGRYKDMSKQLFNGIQMRLVKFQNTYGIREFPEMDIHLDFNSNFVEINRDKNGRYNFKKIWPPYDIDFQNLRTVSYLGIDTFAPSSKDTDMVLSKQYGKNYLKPDRKYLKAPWKSQSDVDRVISFGTFDMLHIGHLNILKSAKSVSKKTYLTVGVSTDDLNYKKKKKNAIINQQDRLDMIKNLKFVDECFLEESLSLKLKYCIDFDADILVMGDDHIGRFDFLKLYGIKVIYLPRTENVSTSLIIQQIKSEK